LPNLISILVSGQISKENFESIMALVQKYLGLIKESRKKVKYIIISKIYRILLNQMLVKEILEKIAKLELAITVQVM